MQYDGLTQRQVSNVMADALERLFTGYWVTTEMPTGYNNSRSERGATMGRYDREWVDSVEEKTFNVAGIEVPVKVVSMRGEQGIYWPSSPGAHQEWKGATWVVITPEIAERLVREIPGMMERFEKLAAAKLAEVEERKRVEEAARLKREAEEREEEAKRQRSEWIVAVVDGPPPKHGLAIVEHDPTGEVRRSYITEQVRGIVISDDLKRIDCQGVNIPALTLTYAEARQLATVFNLGSEIEVTLPPHPSRLFNQS